ncbi:MAG TPA: ATP synthase F1 subunit epsilon [Patescibacteria group bacterium]|nr:ATP synthase F1 subunit epsilon [Patescibacteria group bacterium]
MPLNLSIVTQEKELLSEEVESITVMTTSGEITLLPSHVPLMTKLADTELIYRIKGQSKGIAISGGFLNMEPNNKVVVLADAATRSEDINEAKAEEARQRAYTATQNEKLSRTQIQLAEGELRKAILELKVARRRKTSL